MDRDFSIVKDSKLFENMQTGAYFKAYRKTVPSKVYVTVLNPWNNEPEGIILEGEKENAYIKVWNEMQDMFFQRMNKRHLETGVIIPYEVPAEDTTPKPPTIEQLNDEELKVLIKKPFMAFQNALNKTESEIVLHRIRNLAVEMEVSTKILDKIDARIAEIEYVG